MRLNTPLNLSKNGFEEKRCCFVGRNVGQYSYAACNWSLIHEIQEQASTQTGNAGLVRKRFFTQLGHAECCVPIQILTKVKF